MGRFLFPAAGLLLLAIGVRAQTTPDSSELTQLLNEFLSGASRSDAAMHDRFWADDLIYTGSSGRRVGKADIMRDVRSAPPPNPEDPKTAFSAEDIRIQQYGDAAVVSFQLIGKTEQNGTTEVMKFLNTGTFLKRNGHWEAVSWQATKEPRPEDEARKEVAAAQTKFHQAVLAADVKTLEAVVDESFIWTDSDGKQATRAQLIEELRSRQLKYSKLQTGDVTVAVYGDTAVVRGVSERQRSVVSGSGSPGDASPFTAFYTLTFVNQGGGWKAVALHTSLL